MQMKCLLSHPSVMTLFNFFVQKGQSPISWLRVCACDGGELGFRCLRCQVICSLRSADVFPVVDSLPPKNNGGRESTTGNTSALRWLGHLRIR